MTAYVSASANKKLIEYLKDKACNIKYVSGTEVSYPVSTHPDIFYCELKDRIYKGDSSLLGSQYPMDVLYNAAAVGNYIICSRYTHSGLIKDSGLIPIVVPQSYVKCNMTVVDKSHVITEDRGIAKVLSGYNDIDCLVINPHEVRLSGYAYGFIGGASGRLGSEIIFNGDISKHSSYSIIKSFIEEQGLSIRYFDYPLEDIGSILFDPEGIE